MKIVIESPELDSVLNEIEKMAKRGIRTAPLMRTLGNVILQSVDKNFEEQGRPQKWKPLSPFTLKVYEGIATEKAQSTKAWAKAKARGKAGIENRRIAKDVHGGKLLMRSGGGGGLRGSITIGDVTDYSVEVGSSLVYARIHQLGGTIVPKRFDALYVPFRGGYLRKMKSVMPARPYLMLQNEDETFIMRAVEDYFTEGRT